MAGDTARMRPSTVSPVGPRNWTAAPGWIRGRSDSETSARHSRRPPRIRRSSSAPALTTCPGCTLRPETMPAYGARRVANPRRSTEESRSASAAASCAAALPRLARSSSKFAVEMSFCSSSESPRADCARASSRLARACARLASACRACTSSVRRSSRTRGCPAETRLPTSTRTCETRRPASSTPSDISCQAATEPEATTSRATVWRTGAATVTVMDEVAGAVAAPGLPPLQPARLAAHNTRTRERSRSADIGVSPVGFM